MLFYKFIREFITFLTECWKTEWIWKSFFNVTHLTIPNKIVTWEEIARAELLEWKVSFRHLVELTIINQKFEASCIDILSAIA